MKDSIALSSNPSLADSSDPEGLQKLTGVLNVFYYYSFSELGNTVPLNRLWWLNEEGAQCVFCHDF
jgi:hypothetical protein